MGLIQFTCLNVILALEAQFGRKRLLSMLCRGSQVVAETGDKLFDFRSQVSVIMSGQVELMVLNACYQMDWSLTDC